MKYELRHARADIENGLLDWLQFQTGSHRKVIARRKIGRRIDPEEALAMRFARALQDEARISILTRITETHVSYVAERLA